MSETQDKPKGKKKDVDALLSEVTAAAPKKSAPKAPKAETKPAAKSEAKAEPKAGARSDRTIRIRQIKSGICAPVDQKQTLVGLGLRRIRHEVVRPDTPSIRGLVRKVRHLVAIVGE